jgi:hypothetical protein
VILKAEVSENVASFCCPMTLIVAADENYGTTGVVFVSLILDFVPFLYSCCKDHGLPQELRIAQSLIASGGLSKSYRPPRRI